MGIRPQHNNQRKGSVSFMNTSNASSLSMCKNNYNLQHAKYPSITCSNCIDYARCPGQENCSYILPSTLSAITDKRIEHIRSLASAAPTKKMRAGYVSRYLCGGSSSPTYRYHREIINDCLDTIRAGDVGYLYTEQSLHDLFRYEPTAIVTIHEKVYYISL